MTGGLLAALLLGAYCPSYTAQSSGNTHGCAVDAVPAVNPDGAWWQEAMVEVSSGPQAWGSRGPSVEDLLRGCGGETPVSSVGARAPCEWVRVVAYQESFWQQFCVPTAPPDQVGHSAQTIVSFDCGYGAMQITSGMKTGQAPAFDRQRVAADAYYNLATGVKFLADKWRAVPCVGERLPETLEHWYWALTAYNGFGSINDPHKPGYSTTRGVWNPAEAPADGAPYQEKLWGRLAFPSGGLWSKQDLAYPDLTEIDFQNRGPLSEPDCGEPTDCSSSRPVHVQHCDVSSPDAGPEPEADGGGQGLERPALPGSWQPALGCGCGQVEGASWCVLAGVLIAWRRWAQERRS